MLWEVSAAYAEYLSAHQRGVAVKWSQYQGQNGMAGKLGWGASGRLVQPSEMFWGHNSSCQGGKNWKCNVLSHKPEFCRHKYTSHFCVIIDSCLRTVSGRILSSFRCAWWQIVRDFINVFVWGIQTWEVGEICFVPHNYHIKHLVHLDVICVLAGHAIQTRDCRCLAFPSQITQVISVCHKQPNSSSFQAITCNEIALCLFWNLGGVEGKI